MTENVLIKLGWYVHVHCTFNQCKIVIKALLNTSTFVLAPCLIQSAAFAVHVQCIP